MCLRTRYRRSRSDRNRPYPTGHRSYRDSPLRRAPAQRDLSRPRPVEGRDQQRRGLLDVDVAEDALFDARFEDVDDGAAEQPITPDELFADRLVERPLRAEFEESDVERLAVDRLGLENEPPDKSREPLYRGSSAWAAIRRSESLMT